MKKRLLTEHQLRYLLREALLLLEGFKQDKEEILTLVQDDSSLAEKVSHLPTFLHHSTNDKTSKFSVAEDMFSKLSKINDNVVFDIGNFGHSGWNKIYSNPKHIEWLLSWRK